MPVTFPAWWTPTARARITKIEDALITLFSAQLSGVHCNWWMPTDEQTHLVLFEADEAFLRIRRVGGEVDLANNLDIHRVQFAAAHQNRDVAWDILAFVQRVLYAYEDTSYVTMPNAAKVAMRFRGETLGPLLDPQQIRDARLVPVTVEVETPWPKGLPNIRAELGL